MWDGLLAWMREAGQAGDLAAPRFADETERLRERARVFAAVEGFTRGFDRAVFYHEAQRRRLPWAPVERPEDLPASPQLRARCFFVEVEVLGRPARDLGFAFAFPEGRRPARLRVPAAGDADAWVHAGAPPVGQRTTRCQSVPQLRPERMEIHPRLEPGRSFTSVSSRMIGKFFRERVFQTSFLALLLLSLAIYLGTRAGARTFQREQAGDPSSPTAAANAGLKRAPDAPATTASEGLQPVDSKQNDGQQNASNVFTYIVQPNDTLRALCLSLVGRYDETVQQEIRKLNPNLKDLTHLNPGQEIRLPLNASKQDQPQR